MSDGSTFEVFPNSEVTFRKTYGIGDLLNVWMGKVKVYIQHLPGIPNPNNVTTPTALISVRGTIFDVDVQDLDGTTFVTLDEGIVDVRHLLVASGIVRLNPGESIQVLPNTPLVPLAHDRGFVIRQLLKGFEDAVRQAVYQRPGNTGAGGGTTRTSWFQRRRAGRQGQEYRQHHRNRYRYGRAHRSASRSTPATSSGRRWRRVVSYLRQRANPQYTVLRNRWFSPRDKLKQCG